MFVRSIRNRQSKNSKMNPSLFSQSDLIVMLPAIVLIVAFFVIIIKFKTVKN